MHHIDETHDPALRSWVASAAGHRDFPIQNLPLGIFSLGDGDRRPGVAIGDDILDLRGVHALLPDDIAETLGGESLNALFALSADRRRALRRRLSTLLTAQGERDDVTPHLYRAADCRMHLPATIGDYSDFYVGIHHASNVGALFRPDNPLMPNYKWVPIGYHGRASSVCPSGVAVVRPTGQRMPPGGVAPEFGPTRRLDYELEMGVWMGAGNVLGQPIPIGEASEHIVGLSLLNDWSARDMQRWEYQPLGPFLAKSFHTSVSPWIVMSDALAPFRIGQPARPADDPAPLSYLDDARDQASGAFAIELQVHISTQAMREASLPPSLLSRGPMSSMYWTIAQMVAHQASNGCNIRPGDLLGTGTISAPDRDGRGCLLEMTEGGRDPIVLPNGESRTFLEDGDEVTITASAHAPGFASIGFGLCQATVTPAIAA